MLRIIKQRTGRKQTHGHHMRGEKSPEYIVWDRMKQRCYNPKNAAYHRYGALGITVCKEWRESFQAFFDHVGIRPSLQHSLDRFPNKAGNYEPGNVRWGTREEQQNNRADNVNITYNDKTQTVAQWSRELKISRSVICGRMKKGWTAEQIFETPVRSYP